MGKTQHKKGKYKDSYLEETQREVVQRLWALEQQLNSASLGAEPKAITQSVTAGHHSPELMQQHTHPPSYASALPEDRAQ